MADPVLVGYFSLLQALTTIFYLSVSISLPQASDTSQDVSF